MNRHDERLIQQHPKLQLFQRLATEARAVARDRGVEIQSYSDELRDLGNAWAATRENPRCGQQQLDDIQARIDAVKSEQQRLQDLATAAGQRGQLYGQLLDRCINHLKRTGGDHASAA